MISTKIAYAGDTAVQVEVDGGISIPNSIFLRELKNAVDSQQIPGILETVCTYCTLMVHYKPQLISYEKLRSTLQTAADSIVLEDSENDEREILEIPVLYGGEYGPDIELVAEHEGISVEEVIRRHCAHENYIYFLGFAPGHPYAGCEKETFTMPRLQSPHVSVPKGSVNIWASQTAVYGAALPTGWAVLGRTPYDIYDKTRPEPFLLRAGLWIRFRSITEEEFHEIRKQVENGTVQYKITHRKGAAE